MLFYKPSDRQDHNGNSNNNGIPDNNGIHDNNENTDRNRSADNSENTDHNRSSDHNGNKGKPQASHLNGIALIVHNVEGSMLWYIFEYTCYNLDGFILEFDFMNSLYFHSIYYWAY